MRAQLIATQAPVEARTLSASDLDVPEPGPGQLLVRVEACGVCHTDLHIAEGDLPPHRMPVIPGHQIVGVVEEVGDGATAFSPGDRVGAGWLHSTCGECRYCESGRENLCDRALFAGYDVDGGFAEYTIASERTAFPIPPSWSAAEAAPLLCGGVIGYRAYRMSGAREGETLGLYGFGSSAHIVIQLALYEGCGVRVYTRSEHHREMALAMGASWAGGAALRQAQDGRAGELDAAIMFAPAGGLVPMAMSALRKGGTLVLAGIHMSPIPEMPYELLYGERGIRSVANFTRRDAVELLELAAEIPVRTQVEVFPLERATEALRAVKRGAIDGSAVLVV